MSEKFFTDENFDQEVLKSDQPAVVDFFATWCGPCKMQGPVIEELAKEMEGQAIVGKVDVDTSAKLSGQYEIMSVPTIIIFKNGEIKQRLTGLQSKDVLMNEIKKLI